MALSDAIAYGITGFLALGIILLIVFLIVRNQQTNKETLNTKFYTFSAYDDSGGPATLTCPTGTISVIDARYEVADPYKQCQTFPASSSSSCTGTSPTGFSIACQPTITGCQVSGQTNPDGTPISQGPWQCSIVDATPYVALIANGKTNATLSFSDNLGPEPCQALPNNDKTVLPKPDSQGGPASHQGYYIHGIFTCTS